eukprot:COSAG06_NODE_1823_length_8286_cov_32.294613_8_plen_280_part_00
MVNIKLSPAAVRVHSLEKRKEESAESFAKTGSGQTQTKLSSQTAVRFLWGISLLQGADTEELTPEEEERRMLVLAQTVRAAENKTLHLRRQAQARRKESTNLPRQARDRRKRETLISSLSPLRWCATCRSAWGACRRTSPRRSGRGARRWSGRKRKRLRSTRSFRCEYCTTPERKTRQEKIRRGQDKTSSDKTRQDKIRREGDGLLAQTGPARSRRASERCTHACVRARACTTLIVCSCCALRCALLLAILLSCLQFVLEERPRSGPRNGCAQGVAGAP